MPKFMIYFINMLDNISCFLGLTKKLQLLKFLIKISAKFVKPDSRVKIEHVVIEGIPVTITKSCTFDENSSDNIGVIYFHGGGWILGHPDLMNDIQLDIASSANAIVFSPDYVLVPEKAFPGSFDDCYTVATHILGNAEKYSLSPEKITIMGESAGGNLTAAVVLKLRDKKFPVQPKLQVLLSPCLQAIDFCTDSYMLENPTILKRRDMLEMWNGYGVGHSKFVELCMRNQHIPPGELVKYRARMGATGGLDPVTSPTPDREARTNSAWADLAPTFTSPYLSPLCADSLADLPAALVVTNGDDILADDGVWYVGRLAREGGDDAVLHWHYEVSYHAALSVMPFTRESLEQRQRLVDYIKREFK